MIETEVHSGTKPGRPTVLLILCAIALVAALGLAWLQVGDRLALGPPRGVPDTPLIVRPPRDWVRDPRQPGSFVLEVPRATRGGQRLPPDRTIRFGYDRWPAFQPPGEWLMVRQAGVYRTEPARIGRFDGVQVRRVEQYRWGPRIIQRESVVRAACLPGGHLISVVYIPMTDLTVADLRLLDKVCDAIRIDLPTLGATHQEALHRAGVDLELQPRWQVELPGLDEVPGFFVSGTEQGLPAWSLGVFRTWLASDRTPADLLHDFAATRWLLAQDALSVQESTRADGARVAAVRHPNPARNQHPVAAAWVVAESASEAVIIFAYTNERHARAADAVVRHLVETLHIAPIGVIPDVAAAEEAGAALAAGLIRREDPDLPRWPAGRVRLKYRGTTLDGSETKIVDREAIRGNPRRGYEGTVARAVRNMRWTEQTHWTLDGRAVGYTYTGTIYLGGGTALDITEQRSSRGDVVQRVIEANGVVRWSGTFEPGPAFVCPPIEGLAEAWVARQPEGAWLLRVSVHLGRGTHSRLLRPLSPTDEFPRILLLNDYWPLGAILAFDADGELRYRIEPTARYDRVR